MSSINVVTRWEDWRKLMGPPSSRQRKAINAWLETRPCLLFWGDSWFSTPLYPNLARQAIARMDALSMLIGKPGAQAAQLFSASAVRNVADRIASNPFDLLCVSAGGNDALSERLQRVFADWTGRSRKPPISADDAYALLLDSGIFTRIHDAYVRLLDSLAPVRRKRPAFRVIAHGYAPLVRIGVAGDLTVPNIGLIAIIKDDVGPWLWSVMKHVLPDLAEGKRFADRLLSDGFRDTVLVRLRRDFPDLFDFVDFGTVAEIAVPTAWYDEIHPTGDGFAALAPLLTARIRTHLPQDKRTAVR